MKHFFLTVSICDICSEMDTRFPNQILHQFTANQNSSNGAYDFIIEQLAITACDLPNHAPLSPSCTKFSACVGQNIWQRLVENNRP